MKRNETAVVDGEKSVSHTDMRSSVNNYQKKGKYIMAQKLIKLDKYDIKINKKPKLLQLFCRHEGMWFKKTEPFFNLSGETQYKICTKCGKVLDTIFKPND